MPLEFRDGPPAVVQQPVYKPRKKPEVLGRFVASKLRPKFHRPDCKWMRNVSPENMIWFESHEEAAKEFKPCGTCRA
jgi:methylphosphotriester-DNA--protein-cysteine methyltransferase